jgi:hypothetical protein
MRVSELSGALLAEWVARANGWKVERDGDDEEAGLICWDGNGEPFSFGELGYRPDLNWAQGGPLLDKFDVAFLRGAATGEICAFIGPVGPSEFDEDWMTGPDRLIAAGRAIVASVYGDTVPDEPA